jgi:RNA polymerase sigma-70 factor, ECF subfamily
VSSVFIHRAGLRPQAGETERELLALAQDGDAAAFEQLAGRYVNRLFLTTLRLLGNYGDADDVVQETLLRAWRGIRGFRRRSGFYTWLYRIAVNEANRSLKKGARRPETIRLDEEQLEMNSHPDNGPALEAEHRELCAALKMALLALPTPYRTAVVLRDIEGFSTREAAEIAGVGEAAFKSRLHQGRLEIRAALGDQALIAVAT